MSRFTSIVQLLRAVNRYDLEQQLDRHIYNRAAFLISQDVAGNTYDSILKYTSMVKTEFCDRFDSCLVNDDQIRPIDVFNYNHIQLLAWATANLLKGLADKSSDMALHKQKQEI